MNPKLAIVIPAYKPTYFKETLRSIQAQTDQRFTLYIFDDASPANIEEILKEVNFEREVNFHRFDENVGKQSVIKQWERCINHTQQEEWIWLFSDDDIMASDCVESFYEAIHKDPGYAAYRFDTQKILADGEVVRNNRFPHTFSAATFLNLKLSYEQESYIVEYIFSRKAYENIGGIPDLPMAWASDDLFVVKLAEFGKICTIQGGNVQWRYSESNISGYQHRDSAQQKMYASLTFVKWILNHETICLKLEPENLPITWYIRQIKTLKGQLTLFDEWKAVRRLAKWDNRTWKSYFNMKMSGTKMVEWLKRYSS